MALYFKTPGKKFNVDEMLGETSGKSFSKKDIQNKFFPILAKRMRMQKGFSLAMQSKTKEVLKEIELSEHFFIDFAPMFPEGSTKTQPHYVVITPKTTSGKKIIEELILLLSNNSRRLDPQESVKATEEDICTPELIARFPELFKGRKLSIH